MSKKIPIEKPDAPKCKGMLDDWEAASKKIEADLQKISKKHGVKRICTIVDDSDERAIKGGSLAINTFGKVDTLRAFYALLDRTTKKLAESNPEIESMDFNPDEYKEIHGPDCEGVDVVDQMLDTLKELNAGGNTKLAKTLKRDQKEMHLKTTSFLCEKDTLQISMIHTKNLK